MQTVLSTIQEISQKRLKGMPKSIGSIRSHNGTEKHMAANGISPSSRAPADGFFTDTGELISLCRAFFVVAAPTNLGNRVHHHSSDCGTHAAI
jgi:hypothetical protein